MDYGIDNSEAVQEINSWNLLNLCFCMIAININQIFCNHIHFYLLITECARDVFRVGKEKIQNGNYINI
jgi:hypothetical protein